jgi:hypothetical protein
MRVCGCEISAQEVRLAVVQLNDEQNVELLWIKSKECGEEMGFSELISDI